MVVIFRAIGWALIFGLEQAVDWCRAWQPGDPEDAYGQVRSFLAYADGVLVRGDNSHGDFPHRRIFEFLVAQHLVRSPEDVTSTLVEKGKTAPAILAFASAQTSNADPIIRELMEGADRGVPLLNY